MGEKIRIVISVKLPENALATLMSCGFQVNRIGRAWLMKVGRHVLTSTQLTVQIEPQGEPWNGQG